MKKFLFLLATAFMFSFTIEKMCAVPPDIVAVSCDDIVQHETILGDFNFCQNHLLVTDTCPERRFSGVSYNYKSSHDTTSCSPLAGRTRFDWVKYSSINRRE